MSSGRGSGTGDVDQQLIRVLGGWAAASIALGGAFSLSPRTRGFGRQTLTWGAVDGAIAYVGARHRVAKGLADPDRLRRILLINAGLDIGYLAVGAWLVRRTRWRGDGLAVLVQGAFLLVLDTTAAERLRVAEHPQRAGPSSCGPSARPRTCDGKDDPTVRRGASDGVARRPPASPGSRSSGSRPVPDRADVTEVSTGRPTYRGLALDGSEC